MGWFTSKKLGHIVRNEKGTMVGKLSMRMLEATLDEFGNEFKLNTAGTKYVYTGEGFSAGTSDMLKMFFWHGYTIDCATVEMR